MKQPITAKQYFFTLNLTYYLQAFSVAIFSCVVVFLISQRTDAPTENVKMWHYIVPTLTIISLIIAYFVFKMMVDNIKPSQPLREKMPVYGRAILVRSALLELPGFLAAIAAYLSAQNYFIGASVMIFVIFLILRPTKNGIANDLKLSQKERALLDDDTAIISEVNK
jgi:hypothetical protein